MSHKPRRARDVRQAITGVDEPMTPAVFPVLWPRADRKQLAEYERLGCPRSVPWSPLAPHEAFARSNHGSQSLDVLASRGGLDPGEMCDVIEHRRWSHMPLSESVPRLLELIAAHAAKETANG